MTAAGAENINILAESTAFPLAIEVKEKGNIFYKLVHPREAVRDGSMTIFADCASGDKLRLLRATSDELTESIGTTMSETWDVAWCEGKWRHEHCTQQNPAATAEQHTVCP